MNSLGINPFRALVLRVLFQHPEGLLSGQVAGLTGGNPQTTWRHLVELERQGLVESSAPDDEPSRQGQRVVYRLRRDARDRAIRQWLAFLDGEDDTTAG